MRINPIFSSKNQIVNIKNLKNAPEENAEQNLPKVGYTDLVFKASLKLKKPVIKDPVLEKINSKILSYIEKATGESFPTGDFLDADGKVIGKHNGIIRYTVGQRKGLGISLGARVFVSSISAENNTVTLAASPPMTKNVRIANIVFSGIQIPPVGTSVRVSVKLRYAASPISASVIFLGDGTAEILLDEDAKSVTPGQAAVAYVGETVAFCGFIC